MSASKVIEAEQTGVRTSSQVEEPPMFEVLLLNDDYTTMDFVVAVLERIFHKDEIQATEIMLNVHRQGAGVAGVYSRDIAETKVAMVHDWAQQEGYPLRCTIRKV